MKKIGVSLMVAMFAAVASAAAGVVELPPPQTVPEGGSTFALLGLVLASLFLLRSKLAK
jgi:hypothetical protein